MINNTWKPSAEFSALHQRALLLRAIREFFFQRDVLEVESPLMSHAGNTEPNIESFTTAFIPLSQQQAQPCYLQTSPEFHMKRLLAAGSGAIYQIAKVFRNGEVGSLHNPEFSMLEWYRPGFTHHDLMNEMDELLQHLLQCKAAMRMSYRELFLEFVQCDPFACDVNELKKVAQRFSCGEIVGVEDDKDVWLDIIMSHAIQPRIGFDRPIFLYDFPSSQASLARVEGEVAQRFEVYINGIELANGFHELCDGKEQLKRFIQDNEKRRARGLKEVAIDHQLIAALEHGLPPCAGVALGIDRVMLIKLKKQSLSQIVSFDFTIA